jgi:RNA polymerase sigma-70 factor, ECF subfamily
MQAPAAFRRRLIDAIPRLRRYAQSLEHDAAACDDLVQQTLERALLHWNRFDPQRDLVVWLLSIAHNAFIDTIRRDRQLRHAEPLQAAAAQDGESPSPQEVNVDPGLRLDLQAALASLPASLCEPLLLVCMEQLSYAEVAEVLNLPIGTVLSRVHRARLLLRAFLGGDAVPPRVRQAIGAPSLRRVV